VLAIEKQSCSAHDVDLLLFIPNYLNPTTP